MSGILNRTRNVAHNSLLYLGNYPLLKLISPRPTYAEVRVTEACNSRCVTCAAWKNSRDGELSTQEMVDALQQLKGIGVNSIRISGGEPLIRSDIIDLVKECNLLRFQEIYVATNGLLLQQKAEELVKSGVTHIGVSLDGIEETNDMIRRVPRDYERVLKGVEAVTKSAKGLGTNVPVTFFTTLLKQNIREVPALLKLSESLGVRWDFSLLDGNIDLFEGIDVSQFAVTDSRIIDDTIDYLKNMSREKPWLVYSQPDIIEYARNYLKGRSRNVDVPCILGYKTICLGSRGEVYPGCYSFRPVGNIRKERLREIVRSRRYRELAERMYRKECPSCTFFFEDNVIIRNLFPRAEKIRNLIRSR